MNLLKIVNFFPFLYHFIFGLNEDKDCRPSIQRKNTLEIGSYGSRSSVMLVHKEKVLNLLLNKFAHGREHNLLWLYCTPNVTMTGSII